MVLSENPRVVLREFLSELSLLVFLFGETAKSKWVLKKLC